MALALVEAGARAVYCVDLPKEPSEEWTRVRDYAKRLDGLAGEGRLEYFSADVRDQERMWKLGETIGDREGRLDACVAAAGILKSHTDCLEYPAKQFQDVSCFAYLHGRPKHSSGFARGLHLVPSYLAYMYGATAHERR